MILELSETSEDKIPCQIYKYNYLVQDCCCENHQLIENKSAKHTCQP